MTLRTLKLGCGVKVCDFHGMTAHLTWLPWTFHHWRDGIVDA